MGKRKQFEFKLEKVRKCEYCGNALFKGISHMCEGWANGFARCANDLDEVIDGMKNKPYRMNHETRAKFIAKERVERDKIMRVDSKGGEYSRCNMANANFHRIALFLGISSEEVCIVYLLKHLDALLHIVKTGKSNSESARSRLHDLSNYTEILHSLMCEDGFV